MKRKAKLLKQKVQSEEKILLAGFGGQGIMFLGKVLAKAGVLENKNVTYIRSYGAEMRGGTANCMVKISKNEIASPIFEKATVGAIFNQPSLDKFLGRFEKGGFLLLNSSLVKKSLKLKNIKTRRIPLNELALKLGSLKVANIIGLGFLLKEKNIVEISSAEKVLRKIFQGKEELLKVNLEALNLGYNYG